MPLSRVELSVFGIESLAGQKVTVAFFGDFLPAHCILAAAVGVTGIFLVRGFLL